MISLTSTLSSVGRVHVDTRGEGGDEIQHQLSEVPN